MTQIYIIIALVIVFSFLFVQGASFNKLDDTQTPFELSKSTMRIVTPQGKQTLQLGYLGINPPNNPPSNQCTQGKVGLDFLLDTSDSMKCENSPAGHCKIDSLKNAVKTVAKSLKVTDVIAGQKFDSDATYFFGAKLADTDAISEFKDDVDSLTPKGGTATKKGLDLAYSSLALSTVQFPNHSWFLILITDGCPEPETLGGIRDTAVKIKSDFSNIKIITVGIDLALDNNKCDKPQIGGYAGAKKLMEDIASTPADYHDVTAANLERIITNINLNVCT